MDALTVNPYVKIPELGSSQLHDDSLKKKSHIAVKKNGTTQVAVVGAAALQQDGCEFDSRPGTFQCGV